MIYPKTQIKTADVIAARGALPIGCAVRNGVITPALAPSAITKCKFGQVDCVVASTAMGLYMVKSLKNIYYSRNGLKYDLISSFESDEPFGFEDFEGEVHRMVLAGNVSSQSVYARSSKLINFKFGICGGQYKSGRLFAIDMENRFRLRWSGEGGAYDWEEGISGAGGVTLESKGGQILNLVNYGDKLVAVREHSLTVVSAFGTPENFKILATDTAVHKTVKHTAAVADNKLIFFAEGGLHYFDGNKISKLSHPLEGEISDPTFATAYGNGYMLCCRSKSLEREVVLFYDFDFNTSYLIDVPAVRIAVTSDIYAYFYASVCTLEKCTEYTFKSGNIDFGTGERKHLNCIEIECDEPVDLVISNGSFERTFTGVKGRLLVDMCGANFVLSVIGGAEIRNFKAYAEVMSGV